MMEMEVVVKVGCAKMKVPFTGGSMTAMGVNPAKFTTDNLLTQKAIENSIQFKKGLIKRVHVINLAEEVKIIKNVDSAAPIGEEGMDNGSSDASSPITETGILPPLSDAAAPEIMEKEDEKAMIRVEFSLNDDAKDYLEQEFGATKSKLKRREDIIAFAKEKGVDLVFI